MVEEPNLFIQILHAATPFAGTLVTAIGGVAIAKIGANNKNELTAINARLTTLQKVADDNKSTGEAIKYDVENLKTSSRSSRRYVLYRDLDAAIERGWTTLEERREIAKLFESYKILGGNGEIETMYGIYCELSLKKEN
ncbi:TPA: hypothetical protein TZY53_000651 [Streptococcus suis]|nr:hypothetical protein [Streptococcus suis]HEM3850450.1 hypothetical protein [Streptococcus suis]HEM4064130.1 hypothetical protein [Streptococcus suis]